MAISNFKQTIWSKSINMALETITSLRNHCDFEYEKDSKNAKEVKILNVVRPTIGTYVPGTPITLEVPSDGATLLKLDQFKYFNFGVEDVDKAQSVPGLMESLTKEAARGLAEEGDKYVAKLIEDYVEGTGGVTPIGQSGSVITLTKANAVESMEEGFAYLYSKNVKVSDEFYLELAPAVFTKYREALTELSTNNPEMLKRGAVGKINNAYVCIENLLPTGKTGTGSVDNVYYNVLRTSKAIAFAEQIDKVEAYRPHDAFIDAVKALYVFGAAMVRPDEIYVIKTAM